MKHLSLIGIDEVGRGPLAGPVAVGAFLVPVGKRARVKKIFRGVKESKQLSEQKREYWFSIIQASKKSGYVDFCVSFQSEKAIDDKGLSHAIRTALENALAKLDVKPIRTKVLLDGGLKAPAHYRDQKTVIKGDEKELVIALASICAKVLRDRMMERLAKRYPRYGFEVHKGYGTKAHYKAIRKHGVSPIHRRSFL